jgi:hypothetical protein
MANFFNLTLDTTGPSTPTISIDAGATYAMAELVTATIGTEDGDTTGYQMKIWGSVDAEYDDNIQETEEDSVWISYSTSKQVKLSSGDGNKTLYVRIRDDVYNESAQASDSITLDSAIPVVSITGPDTSKISKISGRNVSSFTFTVDSEFVEFKVKVVSSSGAAHSTGVQIPTTAGSTNTSGTEGDYDTSVTPISVSINGADLESASAGDGLKIVKVFVKDSAGNWSA